MPKVIHHNQTRSAKSASRAYAMAKAMGQRASCGRELVVPYGNQQVLRSVYSDTGRDRVAVAMQNRFIPEDCHCWPGAVEGGGDIGEPGVGFCPVDETVLFTDAPDPAYTNAADVPNPPYTRFNGTTSRPMTIALNGSVKSFRKTINSTASGISSWSMYLYQLGFNTTPCGVWVEAAIAVPASGSHDAIGLCIGMGAAPATNFNWLGWFIGKTNGAPANALSRVTAVGTRSALTTPNAPGTTNILRLELLAHGSLLHAVQMNASRAVISETFTAIATANLPPGMNVGMIGSGTGGSGSGTSDSTYFTNFAFGLI